MKTFYWPSRHVQPWLPGMKFASPWFRTLDILLGRQRPWRNVSKHARIIGYGFCKHVYSVIFQLKFSANSSMHFMALVLSVSGLYHDRTILMCYWVFANFISREYEPLQYWNWLWKRILALYRFFRSVDVTSCFICLECHIVILDTFNNVSSLLGCAQTIEVYTFLASPLSRMIEQKNKMSYLTSRLSQVVSITSME